MSRHKKEKKFLEQGAINEAAMIAYLNNELDAQERQQFEKLLKDDPFAQEALEGLQAAQSKVAVSDTILSINRKVRERTGLREKKGFQIHWTNYAWAAVLLGLLIGVGAVLITYIGNQDDNIAMNKDPATESETNLFESKEELKSAETPVTIITDSIQPNQTILPSGDAKPDEVSNNEITTQASKNAEDKKDAAKENTEGKMKEASNTVVTAPLPSSGSYKDIPASISPTATGVISEPARNANVNTIGDAKAESKKSATVTTTQKVVRGSIIEREEADKVTVITMDDAMKNFNSGNYKESSEQFDAILQQQPANADALYFGGISDYINGNARKSEKNFDKLLKEGTKFVDGSKWYKANILLQKDKREEAKKLLDELSQSNGSYKERAIKKKAEVDF